MSVAAVLKAPSSSSAASPAASSASSSSLLDSFRSLSPAARVLAAGVGVAGLAAAGMGVMRLLRQRRCASSNVSSSSSGAPLPCRPLHWVLKVGDLEASVRFYERLLGMHVQRHEEFDRGCEATCNGPYSGWWSKTMMSVTSEEDFSLELTYNYGVDRYRRGNDLAGLHVAMSGAVGRARDLGLNPTSAGEGVWRVEDPDGVPVFLHEQPAPEGTDPFLHVSLHTANLERAVDYYSNVLGMRVYRRDASSALVGYSHQRTKLELVALPDGEVVDRAEAFGRIAFGSNEVYACHSRVVAAGDAVLNAPLTLSTPGKADVLVTILADRDGQEICMVDDDHFRALCATKPGDEVIHWEARAKRIKVQNKFTRAMNRAAATAAATAANNAESTA